MSEAIRIALWPCRSEAKPKNLGGELLVAGQMLHCVQHDRGWGTVIRTGSWLMFFFERVVSMPAKVDVTKCTGCETCVSECPSEAISMAESKAAVNSETCIDCGVCVDACPEEAIGLE